MFEQIQVRNVISISKCRVVSNAGAAGGRARGPRPERLEEEYYGRERYAREYEYGHDYTRRDPDADEYGPSRRALNAV